jgi:hypothetical protein
MWRHVVLTGVAVLCGMVVFGQTRKHFSVDNTRDFKKIVLNYSITSGTCYLSPAQKPDAFSVYSNRDIDEYNHYFDKNIEDKICYVDVKIEDKSKENFSQSISYKVFSNPKSYDASTWKMYLNEDKPYELNLNYGIGEAFVDLSGLSIQNLRINTGSANVNVGYLSEIENQVVMDTFNVKVDVGSLQMRKANLANAKVIIAEVGFGNAFLDLSDPPSSGSYIGASVGAGNLEVLVPKSNTGIKVVIHDSMLCQVKLAKSFTEVEPDIFVNESYEEGRDDQLVFEIDVSLGNVMVKEKK